jgi:hypothetical protein
MTGFNETVPPDLDPDDDATSAEDVGDNVVDPKKLTKPHDDPSEKPYDGDDDIASGQYGPTAEYGDD